MKSFEQDAWYLLSRQGIPKPSTGLDKRERRRNGMCECQGEPAVERLQRRLPGVLHVCAGHLIFAATTILRIP